MPRDGRVLRLGRSSSDLELWVIDSIKSAWVAVQSVYDWGHNTAYSSYLT